jgi:hypothetical protein
MEKIFYKLKRIPRHYPKSYLTLCAVLAMLGYGYLLAFPVLTMVGVLQIIALAPTLLGLDPQQFIKCGIWLAITATAAFLSYRLVTLKFPDRPGLQVNADHAPRLYQILQDIQCSYRWPKIHEIRISDQYELKLQKTPVYGLPFWSTNHITVGLPLLQTLSPDQFKYLLTRLIIQYSKRRAPVTNWVRQLRDVWNDYIRAYKHQQRPGDQVFYWFFLGYSHVYNTLTTSAREADELRADSSALDLINNDDLFNAIQLGFVTQAYLEKQFWPNLAKMLNTGSGATLSPFTKLTGITQNALEKLDIKQWLEKQYARGEASRRFNPSLKARMDNLGRTKIKAPKPIEANAAQHFLQNTYPKVVRIMDTRWLQKHGFRPAVSPNPNKTPAKAPAARPQARGVPKTSVNKIATAKPGATRVASGNNAKNVVKLNARQNQPKPDRKISRPQEPPPRKHANNKSKTNPPVLRPIPTAKVKRNPPQPSGDTLPEDYLDMDALFK